MTTLEILKLAFSMINHIKCINSGCDGKGAIQISYDEWIQCQWCDEKIIIESKIKEIENGLSKT